MGGQTAAASAAPDPSTPKAGACAMVLFGGGGDLTRRLVTPAFYDLATTGLLPEDSAIIGVDHSDGTDAGWRDSLSETVRPGHAVRGQSDAGTVLDKATKAYRDEQQVSPQSGTETHIALKLDPGPTKPGDASK